jgi:hypothetical protein
MRLWSLHPRYLDRQGLLAVWREGLLAQAVLAGRTHGYRHHPQLERFRACSSPRAAIATYLRRVAEEADHRGYRFDHRKIGRASFAGRVSVTRGQLEHEWRHLLAKLRQRDPARYRLQKRLKRPAVHPLFRVTAGERASWEKSGRKREA